MSDPRAIWRLVDRVRDEGYGIFTIPEKQRMHDLVVRLKTRKTIAVDDLAWLQSMDDQLAGLAAMKRTFRRGRGR